MMPDNTAYDIYYHAPTQLRVNKFLPRRVIVVGSCTIGTLPTLISQPGDSACPCDYFEVNHGCVLPGLPPASVDQYDFQIIQIPIRTLIPESRLMRLRFDDIDGHHALFEEAKAKLEISLDNALRWTNEYSLPAFVTNFLVPQRNPMGRFISRYDLRNIVYFVEQLNRRLSEIVDPRENTYLLDFDQLASIHGRRYIQDDAVYLFSHGALLSGYDAQHDCDRLEPVQSLIEQYKAITHEFLVSVWEEALAMWRVLRQIDSVKLIVVDLDDTIWRGVVAEGGEITPHQTEGWPSGVAEALLYLKRRGTLLGIASKNDRSRVEHLWDHLYGGRLALSDFATVKINWTPKPQNMAEILQEVNLLPRSVLFVDDNPAERAAMSAAYPDMRVIGSNPYELRRVLLWAPELEVPLITDESARRTEMVQSQIQRELRREGLSHDDFLKELSLEVTLFEVAGTEDSRFRRSFELLNKTNQFNTTGRRWTSADLQSAMENQLKIYSFEVRDRFTAYGLVGVVLINKNRIEQFVMSCRVLGLGSELAVIATLVSAIRDQEITGVLIETDANFPVRDLWVRAGFEYRDGFFVLPVGSRAQMPEQIKLNMMSRIGDLEPELVIPSAAMEHDTTRHAPPVLHPT